jgi:hypothetical protein
MVKLLALTLSVLQLCARSLAAPLDEAVVSVEVVQQADPSTEAITQELFDTISLYGQYSAAAYCMGNFDAASGYTSLSCPSNNCPTVQSAQSNITLQLTA